jgi:TrpR-related protein YerC/YecD
MKNNKLNFTRVKKLIRVLAAEQSPKTLELLLLDLCTPTELEAMADRLHVAPLIAKGEAYRKIHEKTGVSITTIGRVARQMQTGNGGYDAILNNDK